MAEHLGTFITGRSEATRPLDVSGAHYMGRYNPIVTRFDLDAAQNDTLFIAMVPLDAVLSQVVSEYETSAIGSSVTMDVGFADDTELGISSKTDVLVDDADISSAGTGSLTSNIGVADRGKTVRDLLGLAADVQGEAKMIATLKGANPDTGDICFEQAVLR
jgi:hypothetical protein